MTKQARENRSGGERETDALRQLLKGEDYYLEGEMMVFTAGYLWRRGYCCDQGCRECPYRTEASERPDRGSA
jgi:hypothetical protein